MNESTDAIIAQALRLSAKQRAELAEKLIQSLDAPASDIDSTWAEESNFRYEAYKDGKLSTISAEEVFSKYQK